MAQWLEAQITERIDWTGELHSLRLVADIAPFQAGQFIKLALDIGGEIVGRPYSLVNPPGTQPLDFYFTRVADGPLSQRLAQMNCGDTVLIAPRASGFLVIDEVPEARDLWLISTGTGLGPFLSILRTEAPWKRFARVVLVHAVRTQVELAYAETLQAIATQHAEQFSFIPFVSREPTDFALPGRVPAALFDGSLEARAGLAITPEHSQVMLCGNPEMVKDFTTALEQRRLKKHRRRDPGHISVENYW